MHPPREIAVRIQSEGGTEDDSLVAAMNFVNFSTKIREAIIVYSERPVRILIECLNKDTLKCLLFTSQGAVVVVIDSLNLAP